MKNLIILNGKCLFLAIFFAACSGNAPSNSSPSADTVQANAAQQKAPANSKKKELLTQLIGSYQLQSIYGSMGANTMFDYVLENGNWSAAGSAISAGTREGYDIELTDEDLEKLISSKIIVNEDLSVNFSCKEEAYFETPFDENGMRFLLQKPVGDFIGSIPKELTAKTTLSENYLYLYAEDHIPEASLQFADYLGIAVDAVLLRYNTSTKEFELTLFYADCCDNATLVFK